MIQKYLEITGLTFKDMDMIELNGAFAAQALVVDKDLNLPGIILIPMVVAFL